MAKPASSEKTQTISINQLKPGMYVKSFSDNSKLNIKSEGYISSEKSIFQLRKANITQLVIVPEKAKNNVNIEKVIDEIETKAPKEKPAKKVTVSIDDEMRKASSLYNNARSLQEKFIEKVKQDKSIKIEHVETTTNALVDSIFRNQDALTCMSRLQTKDSYLIEHSLNVSILMAIFAKHLDFEKQTIQELTLGAFLHDVGKTLLPLNILNKPTSLSPKEQQIIQGHVILGLRVIENSPDTSQLALSMIQEHHERLDGSGYPKQLIGEEISKYGRMIAIIDSYDAMTNDRPYRKGIPPIKAFKILMSEAPQFYDEELVEKFIQCMGIYPVGTLVKLTSGKLGIISRLNKQKPLHPFVRVFYNARMNQAIPISEINLSLSKHKDQIDCCIRPELFNINLLSFFKTAFID